MPAQLQSKVIDGKVFAIPDFDVQKYINITRQKWCIISEDCWGGLLYSYLGWEFTSPFINTAIPNEDYYNLLSHIPDCLEEVPSLANEESIYGYANAKFTWKDGKETVIQLFHYRDGRTALKKWQERIGRIQAESPLLIKKTILDDDDAYRFSALPFERKIGFYYKDLHLPHIVCLHGWEDHEIRYRYGWDFKRYVRESLFPTSGFLQYSVMNLFGDYTKVPRV